MSRYELFVFLHVSFAIAWLGAGAYLAVLVARAERAHDRASELALHRDVGEMAPIYWIPTSLATMIFGLLLVADGPWSIDQTWVGLGLAGWLVSFLLGILFFKPEGQRIGEIAAAQGPDDPEIGARLRRFNLVERFQLLVLFLVVLDMVTKPGL